MTWHKLKQTTFKNLSRAQGKKHKRKKRNVVEGFFQTGKCFEKEGKKEKRPLIMRYDFTVPTEDLKSMKKTRTEAYIRYYRVHMQTCQPEQPEFKYWFFVVNFKKMFNEDLF